MLKHLALLIFCASARALLSPALWSYSTQRSRAVKLVHHASLHRSRRLRQSLATGKVTANLAVPSLAQESAPEILTVDISAFFRNDPAGRAVAGEQVRRACESCGIFYITGHGLSDEESEAALNSSRSLFCLTDEQKKTLPTRNHAGFIRGFLGFGAESGSRLFEGKEAYSYGKEWGAQGPPAHAMNGLVGQNLWPDEKATGLGCAWKSPLLALFEKKVTIARALTCALAIALGKEERQLVEMCEGGDDISIMRCFHYLPFETASKRQGGRHQDMIGSSPHTDWGLLTLILQEPTLSSLQLNYKGQWYDVSPKHGCLVVNVGDYVSLLTNGRFVSPLHRVVLDLSRHRHSFVFFFYPSFHAGIPSVAAQAADSPAPSPPDTFPPSPLPLAPPGHVGRDGERREAEAAAVAANTYSLSLLSSQTLDSVDRLSAPLSSAQQQAAPPQSAPPRTFGEFITRKWSEVQR